MNSKKNRSKGLKIGLTILVIILLLLAGIQVFLSYYLDDLVENRLIHTVSEQTLNQYELDIGELTLSVWNRQMELNNIKLYPTVSSSTAPKVDLDQFSISGIQFLPYLFSGSIQVGDVQLIKPVITMVEDSPDSLTFLSRSDSSTSQEKPPTIEIDQFILDGGSFIYHTADQDSIRAELLDFDLSISGIRIDSTSRTKPHFIDFESITTSTGNFQYAFKSGLYVIESHQTRYSTAENIATLDSLKLIPQYPKYEFAQQVGHQQDRISLSVAQLQLQDPDIEKLKAGQVVARKFVIDQADLDVFHSKMVPDGPETIKTFPHMAFKDLNVPTRIDTITIKETEISYSEHRYDVSRAGTVTFANVNGQFSGVTNDSLTISQGHTIILDVTSDVMGVAELDAHFEFPMHLDGSHMARGTLQSIQAENLNPILEPVGLVRASRGTLHSLQFLMDLDDDRATGWVQLVYSNLRIQVLNSDNVGDGGRNRLKTFLANILKIKSNNNKEPFRRGDVNFERDKQKSIFSYWWKSLSTGLKDNVGI